MEYENYIGIEKISTLNMLYWLLELKNVARSVEGLSEKTAIVKIMKFLFMDVSYGKLSAEHDGTTLKSQISKI